MTIEQFRNIMDDIYDGTWPKAKLTPQQRKVFWKVCQPRTAEEVVEILEDHAQSSPYACKPSDITKKMKTDDQPVKIDSERVDRDRDWAQHCEHVEREREQRDIVFGELTPDERDRHKQAAMRDWRLQWLRKTPVDSVAWRCLIYLRVCLGIEPDQANP